MSDEQLQRDIDRVEGLVISMGWPSHTEAWQRLKPRLTPDRERVARAICKAAHKGNDERAWEEITALDREYWLSVSDAAIAAMGETP